jgi:hypothetical protein
VAHNLGVRHRPSDAAPGTRDRASLQDRDRKRALTWIAVAEAVSVSVKSIDYIVPASYRFTVMVESSVELIMLGSEGC